VMRDLLMSCYSIASLTPERKRNMFDRSHDAA
jgi:hypothetical protein